MKRVGLVALLALILVAGASAQDISLIGGDFENLIEQLGAELLPNLEQSAMWGAFPGVALMPAGSGFFMTLSLGSLLSSGILTFATPDNPQFDVLDVGNLMEEILSTFDSDRATNIYNGIQNFFPYPVTRTTIGYQFPAGVEAMVDIAAFPQFITGWIGGLLKADSLQLNALHVGSLIRVPILKDAGAFPAISIGAGYSYGGMTLGYDLSTLEPISVAAGNLHLGGLLEVKSQIHTFGLDIRASKALGFFVPFIGLAPYYHIASFSGHVGDDDTFGAFLDVSTPPDGVADSTYFGTYPSRANVDNDLSMLLTGGFDLMFQKVAFEFHGSWNIGKGSPGVAIGMRWQ